MASPIWHSVIVFQILKILTTPWQKQEAFKLGIIDKDGKTLKRRSDLSSRERGEYTLLHIFVFNLKRIFNKIAIRSKIASYTAALFLTKEFVREETGSAEQAELLEREIWSLIKENEEFKSPDLIQESLEIYSMPRVVGRGVYRHKESGEVWSINEDLEPIGVCLGFDIFRFRDETFAITDIEEANYAII